MRIRRILMALILVGGIIGVYARQNTSKSDQLSYATPEAAVKDLITAIRAKDWDRLRDIFGPNLKKILSGDPDQDDADFEDFSETVAEKVKLVRENNAKYTFEIGAEEWPFPVPIVKRGDRWIFDTKAGIEEISDRRIGENELSAIETCREYAIAQWKYFLNGDWDNDLVQEFAQKLISKPGRKDGLYWPSALDEPDSPLAASSLGTSILNDSGYDSGDRPASRISRRNGKLRRNEQAPARGFSATPYNGYFFRILKAQGEHAPGGAHRYVVNGNMIDGFAMVSYPAKYGSSGVKSFIVNQQGRIYEKDLGPNTTVKAKAMTRYNPDSSWKLVQDTEPFAPGKIPERIVRK